MGCASSSPAADEGGAKSSARPRDVKFRAISDKFNSVEDVQDMLRSGGLESSQLIVAIDFTKSNEWQGKRTNNSRPLHYLSSEQNQYEVAISSIAKTLGSFDDDHLIPVYGFGSVETTDRKAFNFFENGRKARGLEEVLFRYRELVPHVKMSGPTSFAPAIHAAMEEVSKSGGQYHVLLLLADGQVSEGRCLDETLAALVAASSMPLSIVVCGVGDGPWEGMESLDNARAARKFDNLQFVALSDLMRDYGSPNTARFEAGFALRALMEIPEQYRLIKAMRLLGTSTKFKAPSAPEPPPDANANGNGNGGGGGGILSGGPIPGANVNVSPLSAPPPSSSQYPAIGGGGGGEGGGGAGYYPTIGASK